MKRLRASPMFSTVVTPFARNTAMSRLVSECTCTSATSGERNLTLWPKRLQLRRAAPL